MVHEERVVGVEEGEGVSSRGCYNKGSEDWEKSKGTEHLRA